MKHYTSVSELGAIGTFQSPTSIYSTPYGDGAWAPSLAISASGAVLCAFQSTRVPIHNIYVAYDQDGLGSQYSFVVREIPGLGNVNIGPQLNIPAQHNNDISAEVGLAWDRNNGRAYLVYTWRGSDSETDYDTEIRVISSTDQFQTWSGPARVNNDLEGNGRSQFFPRIAVDQTSGYVAVSWYDCRADPSNVKTQFYVAVTKDGWSTVTPNLLIQSSQSDAVAAAGPMGYGDYGGLDFSGGFLCPVWADNSNSTQDNPYAPTFDIYTATIRF